MILPVPDDLPRFASYRYQGIPGFGVIDAGGICPVPGWTSLRHALAQASLPQLAAMAERGRPIDPAEVAADIPLPDAEKILCVGVNFPDRNAEYKDGQEAPPNPSLFIRFARSFTTHGRSLIRPPESAQLDYEGEIALVIGKPGRRIPETLALDHVAGMTLANEGTLRDWVRHAKFNVTQGKNFDSSGAMGPWLVPLVDPAQLEDIALETRVNGNLRQQDRTSRMIFSFRRIIAYVSTFTTLVPGDTILCGTPTGAGARLDPPQWLVPGDVVEVAADGIGRLVNTVADEVGA